MKKKNHIKVRFSTILLCCLAIVLCAAPSVCGEGYFGLYYDSGEYNVTEDLVNGARDEKGLEENGVLDWLYVVGGDTEVTTVNLYVYISDYVFAASNSVLNIYTGYSGNNIDDSYNVFISQDEPKAQVTVYGTDFDVFAVNSHWVSDDQVVIHGIGELTGTDGNGYPINLTFYCPAKLDVPINLKDPDSKKVEIDIKPGGNPNNINLRSKGVVPVAVLTTDGTDGFDAGDVDPDTVEFAGTKPIRWKICDVDYDGDKDILFHFDTQELFKNDLNEDSIEATLTGKTKDEVEISGTDKVWIVPRKKKK